MELLIGCFIVGMALLIAAARMGTDVMEDMEMEAEERWWINYLADRSRRSKPQSVRPRSRYIRAGIQK